MNPLTLYILQQRPGQSFHTDDSEIAWKQPRTIAIVPSLVYKTQLLS